MNTVEHFLGYHLECIPHEQTNYVWEVGINFPEDAVQLFIILEQRLSDFELVDYRANTQKNESFHQVQLCYGPKNIRFPKSQVIRDNLAVLRYNEGISFEFELRRRLNLKLLDWRNHLIIEKMSDDREKMVEIRKTPEFRSKKICISKIESSKK